MPKVFIYYSRSGNGDLVADSFISKGYDIRKAEPIKPLPKATFFAMMVGGGEALMKKQRKLKDFNFAIDSFESIVIASPIWNGRISSPINTVLANLDLKDKDVTFVFYSGGGEAKPTDKRISKEYPKARVIHLKQPLSHKEELEKLKDL